MDKYKTKIENILIEYSDHREVVTKVLSLIHSAQREERERIEYGDSLSTFIQWKGTDLCMDWFCEDGHQNHWDGDFAYEISCIDCGKKYYPESSVKLNKDKPDFWKPEENSKDTQGL